MIREEIFKGILNKCERLDICPRRETNCRLCPIRETLIDAENALCNVDDIKTEAYNRGLNDGRNETWDFVDRILLYDYISRKEIWGYKELADITLHYTPQEALAKLEAYEEEQNNIKVEVGDIVKTQDEMEIEFVVSNIFNSGNYISYNGVTSEGRFVADARNVIKTGKHIDIQSLLEQIKE